MKAVAYCRFSSSNQREESIDAQLRAINEHCNKNNITLIDNYIDMGRSATSDNRAEFLRMIKDSSKNIFDIVIVHKLDRFARNRYDSAFYKKKLKDNGVKIVSVLEQFDNSPESVILESVLEGMNEYYSKNLAREVKKGLRENALKGLHNGGIPMMGYDVVNGQYVINEAESALVRLIYDLYLQNHGCYSIANILNQRGYKTKKGNNFQNVTVRFMLMNKKYTGVYTFGDIEINDKIPRIIDDDTFEAVQAKFKSRQTKPRVTEKQNYLLTGFLICGVCGHSYVGGGFNNNINGKKTYKYICHTKYKNSICDNPMISREKIEKTVIDLIQEHLLNDDAIASITNKIAFKIKNERHKTDFEMNDLLSRKKTHEKKLDKLLELYLSDSLDKTQLEIKSEQIKKELDHIEYNINLIKFNNSNFDENSIKNFLMENKNKLHDKSYIVKRQLVESFVDRIVIMKDSIEIFLKISKGWVNDQPLNLKSKSDNDRCTSPHLPLSLDKKCDSAICPMPHLSLSPYEKCDSEMCPNTLFAVSLFLNRKFSKIKKP